MIFTGIILFDTFLLCYISGVFSQFSPLHVIHWSFTDSQKSNSAVKGVAVQNYAANRQGSSAGQRGEFSRLNTSNDVLKKQTFMEEVYNLPEKGLNLSQSGSTTEENKAGMVPGNISTISMYFQTMKAKKGDENPNTGKPQKENIQQAEKPCKVAYLTFDDGPSRSQTPQILKLLQDSDIKATFFVLGEVCKINPGLLKQEQAEGHLICNHTYSHEYKQIYSSPQAFMRDVRRCEKVINSILGVDWTANSIIRFPGGSFGKKREAIRNEVKKQGYDYVDWNALSGDAEGLNVPVKKLIENIIKTTQNKNEVVILMHDSVGKETTVKALPDIIAYLKSKGYVFKTLQHYNLRGM